MTKKLGIQGVKVVFEANIQTISDRLMAAIKDLEAIALEEISVSDIITFKENHDGDTAKNQASIVGFSVNLRKTLPVTLSVLVEVPHEFMS